MSIETNFSFDQPLHHLTTFAEVDLLGPLRAFVGQSQKRKWAGTGFNMIWRPRQGQPDFFLQLNFTAETLDITDITGSGIANRGLHQQDIQLGGVAYLQAINDSFDNSGQHFEPGVWANVPNTTNPLEPASVVRMGSIPHGTTINLQGKAARSVRPNIGAVSITPFRIGQPGSLVPFAEERLSNASQFRTPLNRVQALTQQQLDNPNLFLTQAIAQQTILNTVELRVASDASAGIDVGGGADDIAFLIGKGSPPAGGPNANAAFVDSIFWFERVQGQNGAPDFDQLQYSQRVLLNFAGLSWPHITVGTLRAVVD